MKLSDLFSPGILAAAAGGIAVGIDLAGLTGKDFFWGTAELFCGVTAGCGLAALWMQERYSVKDRITGVFLLLCHVVAYWLWVPFFLGLFCRQGAGEPDRQWLRRVLFFCVTVFCGVVGFGFFYWGWSAPVPEIPLWRTLGGLAAAVFLPGICARIFLQFKRWDAFFFSCRFLALYAGVLFFCSMVKLRYRFPAPWYVYAGLLLILAAAAWGGWRKFPAETRKVRWGAWCGVLCLTVGYMVLDCYLDHKYFGYLTYQPKRLAYFQDHGAPVLDACRKYRKKYGVWPSYPEQLRKFLKKNSVAADLFITGFYTDEQGDFRVFFKRSAKVLVMAYNFRADGSGRWEIIAPDHPQMKPGDRRWKYRFPYVE